MKKLKLGEQATIDETTGTIAAFVSLLFVVFSHNQDTAEIHGSTENIIFETHA